MARAGGIWAAAIVMCAAAGAVQPTAARAATPAALQQAAPQSAQAILASAERRAKAQDKNVMVIFHASWCGWCKKLDAFMQQPEFQRTFDANYVVVHLDVLEHSPADIARYENAGAAKLLQGYGGANSGVPFLVWLDAKGKKIADSNALPGGQNIGYPAKPEEVAAFDRLLQQTAPKMDPAQRERITGYLGKAGGE